MCWWSPKSRQRRRRLSSLYIAGAKWKYMLGLVLCRLGYLSAHTVSLLSYFFVVFFSPHDHRRGKKRSREGERRAVKWKIFWWFLVDFFFLTFIYTFFLWCIDVEWDEINFRLFFSSLDFFSSSPPLFQPDQLEFEVPFRFHCCHRNMLWVLEPSKD